MRLRNTRRMVSGLAKATRGYPLQGIVFVFTVVASNPRAPSLQNRCNPSFLLKNAREIAQAHRASRGKGHSCSQPGTGTSRHHGSRRTTAISHFKFGQQC
jgi:hypothetical protein